MSNTERQELKVISQNLLEIHKSLIDYQKEIYEATSGKLLSPYETLHLAMTHTEFEWLRKITSLVVRIDEVAYDKKDLPTGIYKNITEELQAIFSNPDEHAEFKLKLAGAVAKKPIIRQQLAVLKNWYQ